jgi:hypothetical protein
VSILRSELNSLPLMRTTSSFALLDFFCVSPSKEGREMMLFIGT